MSISLLAVVLIGLSAAAYWMGRQRAVATAGGSARDLHSRPNYYGWYVVIWCGVPSLLLTIIWAVFEDGIIREFVIGALPSDVRNLPADQLGLIVTDIRNLAAGNIPPDKASPVVRAAVAHYKSLTATSHAALWVLGLVVIAAGALYARGRIAPALRARNTVEKVTLLALVVCSALAIFVTVGINLGLISPPVGMTVFVSAKIARAPVMATFRATFWWLPAFFLLFLAVAFVPQLSLMLL